MVIFAGIDLLAKFAIADGTSTEGPFTSFLQRFARIDGQALTAEEAKTIYAYRNALMLHLGFHHEDKNGIVALTMFQSDQPRPVVYRLAPTAWELSIDDLYEMFVLAVRNYESQLKTDETLHAQFQAAFPKYGTIHMRGAHLVRSRR